MPIRSSKPAKKFVRKRVTPLSADKKLESDRRAGTRIEHVLQLQQTIGNRAVQNLVESGTFLEGLARAPLGEGMPAVGGQIQAAALVQREAGSKSGGGMDWGTLVKSAKAAVAGGRLNTAKKLYRQAILAAVSGATFPDGLSKLAPKESDIQLDFGKSKKSSLAGSEAAYTEGLEVKNDPANYWKWIFFTSKSLRTSRAYTEAIITHELVHVGQLKEQWKAYEASDKKKSWKKYLLSLPGGKARQKGPVELAGHITGLDFVKRMKADEQRSVLRSIFEHYLHAATYVPPKGVAREITAAEAKTKIMGTFNAAGKDLQKQMGAMLWKAVVNVTPSSSTWNKLVKELRPIVIYGYKTASPAHRKLYREMMVDEGLSFK